MSVSGSPQLIVLRDGVQEAPTLGATAPCKGETFCFQPEAQRGELACLRPHSELVTMATGYLFVLCSLGASGNGLRVSSLPRTSGATSCGGEVVKLFTLEQWFCPSIAVQPETSSLTSLVLSFLIQKMEFTKILVLVAAVSATNDRNVKWFN